MFPFFFCHYCYLPRWYTGMYSTDGSYLCTPSPNDLLCLLFYVYDYLRIITYSYKFTTYYIIYIIIIITTIHRVGNKTREIRNEKLIWKTFSDDIIRVYNIERVPIVFVNSNFHVPIPRYILVISYYINNNVTFRKSY